MRSYGRITAKRKAVAGYTAIPPSTSGTSPTSISAAVARAQFLLGSSVNRTPFITDFGTDQDYAQTNVGTGAASTLSVTAKGGVLVMTTGSTAIRSASITPHGAPCLVDNPKTTPWYIYSRAALGTGVDSVGYLAVAGLATPSISVPVFAIGGIGAIGTTNFMLYATDNAGATQVNGDTGVPLDLLYHDFEVWSDGAFVYGALDKVASNGTYNVRGANTSVGTSPMTLCLQAVNGATATARTQSIDLLVLATVGN